MTTSGPERVGNAVAMLTLLAIAISLLFVQSAGPMQWRDPGGERLAATGVTLALYAGFCGGVAWVRRRRTRARPSDDTLMVVHASQTGSAQQLADVTAKALASDGTLPPVLSLDALDHARLARARRILFIVSTTGDGDAPDSASRFIREVMAQPNALYGLEYGLLALGDRQYEQFCQFGRVLDHWLSQHGAVPLFDRIDVDGDDRAAVSRWQAQLTHLGARANAAVWHAETPQPWKLISRDLLNAGSQGGPVHHLRLTTAVDATAWQPGDVAVIQPHHDTSTVRNWLTAMGCEATPSRLAALSRRELPPPGSEAAVALLPNASDDWAVYLPELPHREYSIASLDRDGTLDLVVRQMRQADGRLGLGSGWLTQHVKPGDTVDLRLRTNPTFHPPGDGRPMILIGNGTGIAGLRAHLRDRAARGHHRNWLLFGERSAAHDFLFADEIRSWQASGVLARLDLAFSRDQTARVYVQHLLHGAADVLRQWLAEGAAIYVCGSREGMAPGVHAGLVDALGQRSVDALMATGRYRRDIY